MSFFTVLISAFLAHSASQAEQIYFSQNLDSFLKVRSEIAIVQRLEESCHWEIQNEQFPFHCFSFLKGQLQSPQDLEKLSVIREKINQVCMKTVNQVNSTTSLENKELFTLLGPRCREAINNRVLDLKYMNDRSLGADIEIKRLHETDTGKKTNI